MSELPHDIELNPELTTPIAELNEGNSLESRRPHPGSLISIISVALMAEPADQAQRYEAVYYSTREFAKTQSKTEGFKGLEDFVFTHYIEASRAMTFAEDNKDAKAPADPTNPKYMRAYNDAALSIFDLYLQDPSDRILRRILKLSTEALHHIVATHQSQVEERPMGEVMGNMATLALFSQTISTYTRGIRRHKNFGYITFLKSVFERAISTNDLSFMNEDKVLAEILPQVMAGKTVVKVPQA